MGEHDAEELRRIMERHLGGGLIRDPFGISQALKRKIKSGEPLSQADKDEIKTSVEWLLTPSLSEQYGLAAGLGRDLERYYEERGIELPAPEARRMAHVATIDPSELVAASQSGKKRERHRPGKKHRFTEQERREICEEYNSLGGGMTQDAFMKRFGYTGRALRYWLSEFGF